MKQKTADIIQVTELISLDKQQAAITLIDARVGKDVKARYEEKHLAGARFVDLNTDMADIKADAAMGGRHPLPPVEKFLATLAGLGITSKDHVVIYDDKNGSNAAARLWWMLKAIGYEKVQVLDGGMQEAERLGFPVSSGRAAAGKAEPGKIKEWELPLADMQEVERVAHDKAHIVIDVRDSERYKGRTEPFDLVAGHIPGAINIPFTENLDSNGLFLPPAELREKYETAFGNIPTGNIIVHCGSGVTACHTLLAISYAGMEIPKLYVGSWSEWSRNDKPMATE